MSKITFESSQGAKFEILEGSHVAFKESKGKWFYWEWDEIPSIQEELKRMLAQGLEMLERVNKLIESHPDVLVSY